MSTLNQDAPVASPDKSTDFTGGHWYGHEQPQGWFPLYAPGKNFTLREARKVQKEGKVCVPSVTTYFKVLHKQMLVDWLIGQHLDVALRTPVAQFANTEEWKEHVQNVASNSSRGAADLGTSIHAAIELAVGGQDYAADMRQYVEPVLAERARLGLTSVAQEKAVGSLKYGYGGKVDDICTDLTIVDYKFGFDHVDAYENLQLLASVVGFDYEQFENLELVIVQPRAFGQPPVKSWRLTVAEYNEKWLPLLQAAAQEAASANPATNTGRHCIYCPARSRWCGPARCVSRAYV
jgi:hypothetical protein